MFKRFLFLGTIAVSSAVAFASNDPGQSGWQTVTITPGQGASFTLTIPVTAPSVDAPYALTGNSQAPQPEMVPMQLGQGAPVLVIK